MAFFEMAFAADCLLAIACFLLKGRYCRRDLPESPAGRFPICQLARQQWLASVCPVTGLAELRMGSCGKAILGNLTARVACMQGSYLCPLVPPVFDGNVYICLFGKVDQGRSRGQTIKREHKCGLLNL